MVTNNIIIINISWFAATNVAGNDKLELYLNTWTTKAQNKRKKLKAYNEIFRKKYILLLFGSSIFTWS